MTTHLGIDPGTTNAGLGITDNHGEYVFSDVFSLEEKGGMIEAAEYVVKICLEHKVSTAGIERYVPYKGLQTRVSEKICIFIGCLWYGLKTHGVEVGLYRAIDWKIKLNKYLFTHCNFRNPSKSFDKVYSIAAAEMICGKSLLETKFNHESGITHRADALCLSHMWFVELNDRGYETKNKIS